MIEYGEKLWVMELNAQVKMAPHRFPLEHGARIESQALLWVGFEKRRDSVNRVGQMEQMEPDVVAWGGTELSYRRMPIDSNVCLKGVGPRYPKNYYRVLCLDIPPIEVGLPNDPFGVRSS